MKATGIKMVSLSLDGSTESVHDDFRSQKGAFAGVVNAASLFNKHGIQFLINSSFTKRNQHEIPKVYKLAKELGATAWYMFMIVPTGRGEEIMEELIPKEDYEELLEWHYEMEKNEKDMLVRPTCAPHYYRVVLQKQKEEGEKFERRSLKFSTGGSKGCIAGQVISLIDVDENVLPCSYFPKSAGNLKEQTFKDIWENSELFKEMRNFKGYKGRCGSCEYISVCGGCRARAYAVSGDYLEEEPFCGYVPYRIRKAEQQKSQN
jgi:radical SAM protein with 4Fe4S-binding SPASM domain